MEDSLEAPRRSTDGHDLDLLRESLALTPTARLRRLVSWVELIEELRRGLAATEEPHASAGDLPRPGPQ
jgi:hypothetical protein